MLALMEQAGLDSAIRTELFDKWLKGTDPDNWTIVRAQLDNIEDFMKIVRRMASG